MVPHTWRRTTWRRLAAVALVAVIGFNPLLARAQEVGRHAVLVVDANTGRVLHQRSPDEPRFPASLVKLMTLLILFEQIELGNLALSGKIRFSANAVSAPPSSLDVEEGTEIDVMDAIKALITKSANDVAIAVAEHIAGSEEKFAELMNRRAREIGMKATVFRNASGLPDPDQVTTARDMIVLALRLHDQYPKYYPLFATRTFTWGGDTYRNHNTLLFRYQGLDGMKTGYIRASGFNLVASAKRGGKHVVVAYFGGKTGALRNAAVRAHLDAGFVKASARKTREPGSTVLTLAKAPPVTKAEAPPVSKAEAPPNVAPGPQSVRRPPTASEVEMVRVRPVRAPLAPLPTKAPPTADAPPVRGGPPTQPDAAPESPTPPQKTGSELSGAPSGPFQIQIGAFNTPGEAERQLAWVRQRAGTVLGAHVAHMSQIKRGDKVFFRARYIGFEAHATATGVCSELKRMEIDCFVMRGE